MIRRLTVIVFALVLAPLAAQADDVGDDTMIQIDQERATPMPPPPVAPPPPPMPVEAPPPPFVELHSMAIGAGLGARFGDGSLLVAGQEHSFRIRGLALGDLGISSVDASGYVENLDRVEDFAGRYVAVEAGAAAGIGASTVRMRNEHGVVIRLDSNVRGVQLTLAAQGFDVELD